MTVALKILVHFYFFVIWLYWVYTNEIMADFPFQSKEILKRNLRFFWDMLMQEAMSISLDNTVQYFNS